MHTRGLLATILPLDTRATFGSDTIARYSLEAIHFRQPRADPEWLLSHDFTRVLSRSTPASICIVINVSVGATARKVMHAYYNIVIGYAATTDGSAYALPTFKHIYTTFQKPQVIQQQINTSGGRSHSLHVRVWSERYAPWS